MSDVVWLILNIHKIILSQINNYNIRHRQIALDNCGSYFEALNVQLSEVIDITFLSIFSSFIDFSHF